jgi:phosphatidylinositol alpha-mannosyltransferase
MGEQGRFDGLMDRERVHGVDFIGFVPKEELPRYYRSCDIFCAPSIHGESFGIVLLEAAASGRPVVGTNIPGYASVLTNGTEALFDVLRNRVKRIPFSANLSIFGVLISLP